MSQKSIAENRLTRRTPHAAHSVPFAGLRFAIYARRSTLDARHEDHKSVARQVEQATRYVEARGGEVLRDHCYVDDDASGAEFKARAGLLRFLDALKNGRPFNAVVMSEESRLGREQVETAYVFKQIRDAGLRIFFYMTDQEARLDSALEKIMSSLTLFGAELEREKARQRARDAAERKARQGLVTGGEPYGYENVRYQAGREVPRGHPHDYVKRRIRPDEAEVVRGIFRMYTAGWGFVKIAKAMNGVPEYAEQTREFFGGQRVPPPRNRTGSWAPTAIREMLHRPLYHGEILWGRTTHTDRDGRAGIRMDRPEEKWLTIPAPELKIVPDDLWEAVQQRLKLQNEKFVRDCRGKLWGKPDRRQEGRYLLTGLARCGVCGWNLGVIGGRRRAYGCIHAHKRGACANDLSQPVDLVDAAFLDALEREALTPERFCRALEYGVERVRDELAQQPDRRPALEREKAALARRIGRMVEAIGDGRGPAALVQEIAKGEARIKEIEAGMARLAAVPALDELNLKRIERDVEGQLARFADLLKGNIPRARQALKQLLVDRVEFTPGDLGDGRRTYQFQGELAYGAVLREVVYMEQIPLGIRTRVIGRGIWKVIGEKTSLDGLLLECKVILQRRPVGEVFRCTVRVTPPPALFASTEFLSPGSVPSAFVSTPPASKWADRTALASQ